MQVSSSIAFLYSYSKGSREEAHGLHAAQARGFAAIQAELRASSVFAGSRAHSYDFTNVPGNQIWNLGNKLLKEGKITLDESAVFIAMALPATPSGQVDGNSPYYNPSTPYNLISDLEQSILFLKQHPREKGLLSAHESLLAKLKSWQGKTPEA